jgi:hypothetical protein
VTAVSKKGVRRLPGYSPRPEYRQSQARKALEALQVAHDHAKAAGAPYLLKRIKLARASAYGAIRNAGYRVTRARG